MSSQKAIFVPGYGVPESIRSVRFVPKLDPIASEDPKRALSHDSPTLEVWQGDLYGEPTMELMTTFSTSDRMATVYADGEMPFVRPGKSAVAFVHDAPDGYEIEFQSEFIDPQENTVSRTVTLDNHGTARESLLEPKSLQFPKSIASRRSGVRRTGPVARSLGRFFGHLTTSISRLFGVAPSATSFAAQPDVPIEFADAGLKRSTPRSFDDSRVSTGTDGRRIELEASPRAEKSPSH
jgi:hypothetical protein